DEPAQSFARSLGAEWAGSGPPPEELDAAIIFAPAGELVPAALRAVAKGGSVVYAGIHMSDIPSFPYAILWGERVLRSVANLTRQDGEELLALAPRGPVRTTVEACALERRGVPGRGGERRTGEAAGRRRRGCAGHRPMSVLWAPSPQVVASSHLVAYERWLAETRGLRFGGYAELWEWSVDELEAFW